MLRMDHSMLVHVQAVNWVLLELQVCNNNKLAKACLPERVRGRQCLTTAAIMTLKEACKKIITIMVIWQIVEILVYDRHCASLVSGHSGGWVRAAFLCWPHISCSYSLQLVSAVFFIGALHEGQKSESQRVRPLHTLHRLVCVGDRLSHPEGLNFTLLHSISAFINESSHAEAILLQRGFWCWVWQTRLIY